MEPEQVCIQPSEEPPVEEIKEESSPATKTESDSGFKYPECQKGGAHIG